MSPLKRLVIFVLPVVRISNFVGLIGVIHMFTLFVRVARGYFLTPFFALFLRGALDKVVGKLSFLKSARNRLFIEHAVNDAVNCGSRSNRSVRFMQLFRLFPAVISTRLTVYGYTRLSTRNATTDAERYGRSRRKM